jgi:hypothetical protein
MEEIQSEREIFKQYCLKRLSVKREFINLYYEVLIMAALEGKDLNHLRAFNLLNSMYFNLTGKLRFENYVAFTIQRIRMNHKDARIVPIANRLSKDRCRQEECSSRSGPLG